MNKISSPLDTESFTILTENGRSVEVWRSIYKGNIESVPGAETRPIIILSPGFARKIRDLGAICLALARHGSVVYRLDSLDHIGLSDGTVRDFSIGSLTESMWATSAAVSKREQVDDIRIVAMSMASVPAYRIANERTDITRVLALSGVIDVRKTITSAVGSDLFTSSYTGLPETVEIEKQVIDPRPIHREYWESKSIMPERIQRDIHGATAALVNCVASEDPWVELSDCVVSFEGEHQGERLILELPFSGHDLRHNPAAARLVIREITRLAIGKGPLEAVDADDIALPSFEDMLRLRSDERERERERAKGTGRGD